MTDDAQHNPATPQDGTARLLRLAERGLQLVAFGSPHLARLWGAALEILLFLGAGLGLAWLIVAAARGLWSG